MKALLRLPMTSHPCHTFPGSRGRGPELTCPLRRRGSAFPHVAQPDLCVLRSPVQGCLVCSPLPSPRLPHFPSAVPPGWKQSSGGLSGRCGCLSVTCEEVKSPAPCTVTLRKSCRDFCVPWRNCCLSLIRPRCQVCVLLCVCGPSGLSHGRTAGKLEQVGQCVLRGAACGKCFLSTWPPWSLEPREQSADAGTGTEPGPTSGPLPGLLQRCPVSTLRVNKVTLFCAFAFCFLELMFSL